MAEKGSTGLAGCATEFGVVIRSTRKDSRDEIGNQVRASAGDTAVRSIAVACWQTALCSGQREDVVNRKAQQESGDH